MRNVKRVIAQAHHRNGSGSAPFTVTLFEADGQSGTFLAISMPSGDSDALLSDFDVKRAGGVREAKVAKRIEDFRSHTAVIKLDLAIAGDIEFAGANSWRGGDTWGSDLASADRERHLSGAAYPGQSVSDPFDGESYMDDDVDDDKAKALVNQVHSDLDNLRDERSRIDDAIRIHEARLDEAEAAANPPAVLYASDEEQRALDYLSSNPLFGDLIEAAKARIESAKILSR